MMKWLQAIVVGGVAILLIVALGRPAVGEWLVVNQSPRPSDVIIVLGGGPPERVQKAVTLFRDGYAPWLLMSGGAVYRSHESQAAMMAKQAEGLGVPARAIILESRSQTTYQNARFTERILAARHFRSAIVVSSDYHMRRVMLVFTAAYQQSGIRLTFTAAPDKTFDPTRWWANQSSAYTTVSEYAKYLVNWVQVNGRQWLGH